MIVLLSPSKNLHNLPKPGHRFSHPRLYEHSLELLPHLRKLTPAALQKLMEINASLAKLNHQRFQDFNWPHSEETAKSAMYTFRGEVYQGLDANTLSKAEAEYADSHIRILSGLYGLLRPLDLIQPYRLEMGTEIKIGKAKNLYAFWGDTITNLLNEDIAATKSKYVINLASQEYIEAIQRDKLSVPVIDIQFLEDRNGKLQFLSYNAKRSRGWMARYIIEEKVKTIPAVKAFDRQGYSFREEMSTKDKLVFVR